MINQFKKDSLITELNSLGIRKQDLIEKFIRSAGKGGQRTNKVTNCVYIKHLPSGIEIKCQRSRFREDNRFFARRLLCNALKRKLLNWNSFEDPRIQKIKKQKKRRSRRSNSSKESS